MAEKVDPNFPHSIYRFIHRPIREEDRLRGGQFLERYTLAFQRQFEEATRKINALVDLYDPAKTPQPRFLKDIVGFTSELDRITNDITDQDLRKLISLAVALWKEKGLEVGYKDIIRLFTGKNSRIFNWFDFRYIVGEQGLAQEDLGEDSWFIAVPGTVAALAPGNVKLYLSLEQNFKDRSEKPMHAVPHGSFAWFANGPVTNSDFYLHLFGGGFIEVPNSAKFDLSGSFTLELFVKTAVAQNAVLFKKSFGGVEVTLRYNSTTNQITYTLDDGPVSVTETIASALDLDDNTFRHLVLVVNRTSNIARMYFNGTESTAGASIAALGNLTNAGPIYVGAASPGVDVFEGGLDNVRLSASAQYVITGGSIPVPSVSFIEYQEEQLDEFYSDIRIVDQGDLNRTLALRILNLMRPVSERLRVIYIQFFEDFKFGKGNLVSVVPGSYIDPVETELVLENGAVEVCDSTGSADYRDIVVQARSKITIGSRYSIRFLIQDAQNYYGFRMRSDNETFELYKVVGGVETAIASPKSAPITNETFYILSVVTDYNESADETLIKCYQDRNLIFEVVDATYNKGSWGVEAGSTSTVRIGEIEMFLMPLEYDVILPNQVI